MGRVSALDSTATGLRQEIETRRWAVGDRLPNETALAASFQVSRGTIREAVRVLVSEGYLHVRQGSGTYILRNTDDPSSFLRLRRTGLRDQIEVRCALEVEAARLAATRHAPGDIAELHALLDRRGEAGEADRETFVATDLAFHKRVVALSRNKALIEIYEVFSGLVEELIVASITGESPEPTMQAHRDLADAIGTGDEARAMDAARAFWRPVLEELQTWIGEP